MYEIALDVGGGFVAFVILLDSILGVLDDEPVADGECACDGAGCFCSGWLLLLRIVAIYR